MTDASLSRHAVRVRRLRVHALAGGLRHAGGTAVLVHGIGVSSRYFAPLARELSRDRPVFAPDLPGFGESDRPRGVPGIAGLATALLDWLGAAGVHPAVVVANSMGCQVAVEAAVREPEAFDRLVLVGPTVDPHARSWLAQAARLVRDSAREPPSLLAIVAADYAAFGPRRFVRTARSALADAIEAKLPQVRAPTLVVRGEHDVLVPQRWAEQAVGLLPDGRLALVPGAPHACHFTAPAEVAELVRHFAAG